MTELLTPSTPYQPPVVEPVDELDGILTCTRVESITHDVKSFTFVAPGVAPLRFLPGQYLTLGFDVDGAVVERCYTISAPPTRAELTITVKRVDGGLVSNRLHDRMRVGDTVHARGPFGSFSCSLYPARRYLFLTAGSGITPAMSMLRTLWDTGDPADVVFLHSARTPDDIIFRAELDALAAGHGVAVSVRCGADSPHERWEGPCGRLTAAGLLSAAPDLRDREIFSCGPPEYMAAVRGMLEGLDVDPARCHEESFLLGGRPTADAAPSTDTRYRVELRRSDRVLECDSATPILHAAASAGVTLPASCGEGVCGTCKTQRLSGTVDMRHSGGIRPREIEQGKILLCCSTPSSDLVIDA